MVNLAQEWPRIRDVAVRYGVDPYFIAAIRIVENGGPGREFGVMLKNRTQMSDFEFQLLGCVQTVVSSLNNFTGNPLVTHKTAGDAIVLGYTEAFIATVQRKHAPVGVSNDPNNLNRSWFVNVARTYFAFRVLNPKPANWGLEQTKHDIILNGMSRVLGWKLAGDPVEAAPVPS